MSIRISSKHRTGALERFVGHPVNFLDVGVGTPMHVIPGQMASVHMTPQQMIAEWRKGCSCATPEAPEVCTACTRALIDALTQVV